MHRKSVILSSLACLRHEFKVKVIIKQKRLSKSEKNKIQFSFKNKSIQIRFWRNCSVSLFAVEIRRQSRKINAPHKWGLFRFSPNIFSLYTKKKPLYRNGWERELYSTFSAIQNTIHSLPLLRYRYFVFFFCRSFVLPSFRSVRILYFREYIVTWFLKCILRFWIHGPYNSSNNNNNTNNSNITTGRMGRSSNSIQSKRIKAKSVYRNV